MANTNLSVNFTSTGGQQTLNTLNQLNAAASGVNVSYTSLGSAARVLQQALAQQQAQANASAGSLNNVANAATNAGTASSNASSGVTRLGNAWQKTGEAMGNLIGVATGGLTAGLTLATKMAIENADAMGNLSDRTGIAIERLSLLANLGNVGGSSFAEWNASAEALAGKLAKQDEETGKVTTAIKALVGASEAAKMANKGALQIQEEIIVAADKAIKASNTLEEKQRAESLAVAALGTNYFKLRGSVMGALEKKEEYYNLMRDTGAFVTEDLKEKSAAYNDQLDRNKIAMQGVGNMIADTLLPRMLTLAQGAEEATKAFQRMWRFAFGGGTELQQLQDQREQITRSIYAISTARDRLEASKGGKHSGVAKLNQDLNDLMKQAQDTDAKINALNNSTESLAHKKAALEGAAGEGAGGGGSSTSTAKKTDPFKAILEGYQRQVGMIGKVTEAEKVLWEIQNGSYKEFSKGQQAQLMGLAKRLDAQKQLEDRADAELERLKRYEEAEDEINKKLAERIKLQNEIATKGVAEITGVGTAASLAVTSEMRGIGMGAVDRSAMTEIDKIVSAAAKARAELDTTMADYEDRLNSINNAEVKATQTVMEGAQQRKLANQDWTNGAKSAFATYIDSATNVAQQTENLFGNAFKGMEDAIVNFATTGKFAFADFAKSIIADLIRIQARQAAVGFLSSIAGAFAGGWSNAGVQASGAVTSGVYSGSAMSVTTLPGMSSGGYTGAGDKYTPAAIAHKGEVIFSQEDVARNGGVDNVMAMRQGGGTSTSGGNIYNTTINVQGGNTNEETGSAVEEGMMRAFERLADSRIANARRPGGINNPVGAY